MAVTGLKRSLLSNTSCFSNLYLSECFRKYKFKSYLNSLLMTIGKDLSYVGKFDSRSDEGIFLGYSSISKAYRVYNKRTMKVMETVNVVIDESSDSNSETSIGELTREIIPSEPRVVQEVVEQEPASPSTPSTPSVVEDSTDITISPNSESHEKKGPSSRIKQNYPLEDIVGDMNELTLRKRTVDKCVANFVLYSCYLSQIEPTKVEETL